MKSVRVTIELEPSFLKRLDANVVLSSISKKVKEGEELSPDQLLAWLILNEAKGVKPEQIDASIPMMNRSDCPEIISSERRVYEDGKQISGPVLTETNN